MKGTFDIINQMRADGVISHYAIGGAVGATFYLEPAATLDIDIFAILPYEPSGLISLGTIYDYLKARGGKVQDEHIVVEGWPVQFLVPANELERDAVVNAVPARFDDITIWVMPENFLILIALRTGRAKDHLRILQFLESGRLDQEDLEFLIKKYGLTDQWERFNQRYRENERE